MTYLRRAVLFFLLMSIFSISLLQVEALTHFASASPSSESKFTEYFGGTEFEMIISREETWNLPEDFPIHVTFRVADIGNNEWMRITAITVSSLYLNVEDNASPNKEFTQVGETYQTELTLKGDTASQHVTSSEEYDISIKVDGMIKRASDTGFNFTPYPLFVQEKIRTTVNLEPAIALLNPAKLIPVLILILLWAITILGVFRERARRKNSEIAEGVIRNVNTQQPIGGVLSTTFRVERLDDQGNPTEYLQVELSGDYKGEVNAGDSVKVYGKKNEDGVFKPWDVRNLTSGARIKSRLSRLIFGWFVILIPVTVILLVIMWVF